MNCTNIISFFKILIQYCFSTCFMIPYINPLVQFFYRGTYAECDDGEVDKESLKNDDDDDVNDIGVLNEVRSWRVRSGSPGCWCRRTSLDTSVLFRR